MIYLDQGMDLDWGIELDQGFTITQPMTQFTCFMLKKLKNVHDTIHMLYAKKTKKSTWKYTRMLYAKLTNFMLNFLETI